MFRSAGGFGIAEAEEDFLFSTSCHKRMLSGTQLSWGLALCTVPRRITDQPRSCLFPLETGGKKKVCLIYGRNRIWIGCS